MEADSKQNIFSTWFFWHFYEMPKFLFQVWSNYFMFATNLFSVPLLLKTFFSPWRRNKWAYPKGLDIANFFNTLISNTFSRALGALMRIILIIAGIFLQAFVAIAGLLVIIFWLFLPFIVVFGFLFVFFY
jgi:hypothetical protein